ncbi:hypothetical protein GYMLUDRAFT_243114 [Collybiopsis luxurians FD-317 M1]|uniref:Uncharacterized protein n=1 Tax=Collybiopsis luxurians FD-317 M1 TaxID=944289 RepID=A0A0D0C1G9_9AGAR|nr:hypothetical protein GYMLUDRAFT_243114 [Collybiopsis luxurians FD-317 M1]
MCGSFSPKIKTPLASLCLATYQAPEGLTGLETEDSFARNAALRDQSLEEEEGDGETETLDTHKVDEDPSYPLLWKTRLVPNTDGIAIPRGMRATVIVTAVDEPVDNAASELTLQQDNATLKARRNVEKNFTVIYLPPDLRCRTIPFVTLLWSIRAFRSGREVHDAYTVLPRFYMIWVCRIDGRAVDRLDKSRQRWRTEGVSGFDVAVGCEARAAVACQGDFYGQLYGVVIPTLVGGVVELYITLHESRYRCPENSGIPMTKRNGWTHSNPIAATRGVIGRGLTVVIIPPAVILYDIDDRFPVDNKLSG